MNKCGERTSADYTPPSKDTCILSSLYSEWSYLTNPLLNYLPQAMVIDFIIRTYGISR